ncbi:MAG: hypothetical protein J0I68_00235 [Achromobacter sp.]|uniref:hypothetical protein n=1 Tax=Achromobacter sp. TaxID=134375 RepID=UPI001AD36D7E|nr:hypothetical protein [Achromobacter sp.]MBN9636931.1 hypothetical protein [Achromobacter sp.]
MPSREQAENFMKEFYALERERNSIQYAIKQLMDFNATLEEYREIGGLDSVKKIENLINKNNETVVTKLERINEMLPKISSVRCFMDELDNESKYLLELRFKKNRGFESIGYELNISKSTVGRRLEILLTALSNDLGKI